LPDHIRAVFFDAVGTLIHPDPPALAIYARVAANAGLAISSAILRDRFIEAYRAEDSIDHQSGWITSEQRERDRWRHIVTASLEGVPGVDSCFEQLYMHFARPDAWRLDPAAGKLITQLRERGLIVGMGSNYDHRLASVVAGHPELAVLDGRIVISAAIGHRKPSARFFEEVARVAGVRSEEVLFVGDDLENDYHGAIGAGMQAILIDDRNRYRVPNRIGTLDELIG
jgi:putative hydrolase of the HAD superfamily